MDRRLAILALCLMTVLGRAQSGGDEFSAFLGSTRLAPTESQRRELKRLWRAIQIGSKEDRQRLRRALVEMGAPALDFLERKVVGPNAEEARQAALALQRMGDARTASVLRERLFSKRGAKSPSPALAHLVMTLGILGDARDVAPLLALYRTTRRDRPRRAVLYALGRLGAEEALPQLQASFRREKDRRTRAAILLAAGRIGGSGAVSILRMGLKSSKESLRLAACLGLADAGVPLAEQELVHRLRDSDKKVGEAALIGLALTPATMPGTLKRLRAELRHPRSRRRALAALALGEAPGEDAVAALLARLGPRGEPRSEVLAVIALALGRHGGEAAEKGVRTLLAVEKEDVARAALLASARRSQTTVFALPTLIRKTRFDGLKATALTILALRAPQTFRDLASRILAWRKEKKATLALCRDLLDLLERDEDTSRALLEARLQVEIDDLGGSPDWNLLAALHHRFLVIEDIHRSLGNRGPGVPRADGSRRPPEIWTHEEEDMRLWYDLFPYQDRRRSRKKN